MASSRLMKDGLNAEAVKRIASALKSIDPSFKDKDFYDLCLSQIETLELRQRVDFIIEVLEQFLPKSFKKTADILKEIPSNWDYGDENDNLRGFAAWPIIDYIGKNGLDDPEISLELLKDLTHLFTSEFAIRPFLINHFKLSYDYLLSWTKIDDKKIRRLVSEGTRTRLPWGIRLKNFIDDPCPVIDLLDILKDDESEFVRRSVANNLNDISKDHPDLVIEICKKWADPKSENRSRLIEKALRTLVKQGRSEVFPLLGFSENPSVELKNFKLSNDFVKMGEEQLFSFDIVSNSDSFKYFVLDYRVYFTKAGNKKSSKVFKLKKVKLSGKDNIKIEKKHSFKPITTRKYYTGVHGIEILINGVSFGKKDFILKD